MSETYLIGDLHIGHKNILKYRDTFSSIEEHDNLIAENINKVVSKRDNLWLMGDIFFTEDSLKFLDKINYTDRIYLVLGNHCSNNGNNVGMLRRYADIFKKVVSLYNYKGYWLSHAPIHKDELRNKKCIHGHVHTATLKDEDYFNVSCENVNYTPVSMSRIREESVYGRSEDFKLFP